MKKRKPSQRPRSKYKFHLLSTLVVLALGLSAHSCTNIPAGRELKAAGVSLEKLVRELGTPYVASKGLPRKADAPAGLVGSDFSACPQFFASGKPPLVVPRPTHRALCYDAFAILHSGESKTAVYVAQKLNRASVKQANQKRTDKFFADARLREAERATLEDYRGSNFDRGHPGAGRPDAHPGCDGAELLAGQHGAPGTPA